jgi:hypothetical protein
MAPEKSRRYEELAEKLDRGVLTREERAELRALAAESEQLTLDNARALLRHRDPAAYVAALAAERRTIRPGRGRGEHRSRPAAE